MAKTHHGYRVLLCNCPPDKASGIAEKLVEEKLAACVNVVPGVESFYHWQGKLCRDAESTLLIKTRAELASRLTRRLLELHPYEVAEVLSLAVEAGESAPRYLAWIDEVTL